MKTEKRLRRPKKEMMLVVNALIDGNTAEAERLITSHKLDRKELQIRLEGRAGKKYTFERKARGGENEASSSDQDASLRIDGRTRTVTLLRLAQRVQELLAQRPKDEVAKVRKALADYEKRRHELEEMEQLLGL